MFNVDEESCKVVFEAEDSLFPEWLFKPFITDFDDNYYERSFAEDELVGVIKSLRRRYTDFFEWIDAMEAYNKYMERMVEKYGSMRVIKNSLEAGLMMDPIPAKPKLKQNKKNKALLEGGIIPSRRSEYAEPVSDEEILAVARQVFPGKTGEDIVETRSNKLSKDQKKRLEEVDRAFAAKNRRRNLYRSVGDNRGTDFIVEYLNNARKGIYDAHGSKNENKSLYDIVKENEYYDNIREEFLDIENDSSTMIQGSRLVKRGEARKMEIYKELYEEGIDIFGMSKGLDKKSVKMIRTQIGATEPMTKKELKKLKKKNKKDRDKIQKRMDQSRILENTLLGNKISSVNRDANGNLNFRLKDLFNGNQYD